MIDRTVRIFLLVLFVHYSVGAFSQDRTVDSLLTVLNVAVEDADKVNALNALSEKLCQAGDYGKAKQYATDALALATEADLSEFMSDAYNNIGFISYHQSNYTEALRNHFAALKIRKDNGNKEGMATSYNNIGLVYDHQGNYPLAIENYLASLRLRMESNDKKGIATAYNNIGIIYHRQDNFDDALKNYDASLKLWEELGNKMGIAYLYNNIGHIYAAQNNHQEALKSYFASLKIKEELGDKKGIANAYSSIGMIYEGQHKNKDALDNYLTALRINEELGNKFEIALCYVNIGLQHAKLKNYLEARKYLEDGLSVSKQLGAKDNVSDSYHALSFLDSTIGDYQAALEHYKLHTSYKDSILNEDNNEQIAQMKTIYETEKKDHEIALLNKDSEIQLKEITRQKLLRNGFIGGFAFVLLFAIVFFTQRNRITKEKKRSDDLLLNILPAEVAEELKDKGYADAKQFDEVTVIFTDFKGFTTLSQKLSAKDLVNEINDCFKAFDAIMGKYGIEKIKTIGDAYMAVGGLPVSNTTNPNDVVNAALDMRDFMIGRSAIRLADGTEHKLEIRIGINSGPVVAGIVGIKKFQYDIWGDTVNTAARMEQNSEAGKVNISSSTYALVKDNFQCDHRGQIHAKNKGNIDMYFVEKIA
ncbi:MAG: tetratricopeptide repeat protein [Flavobacteriales bacterium]|nr:tetratricopeptide repeat protein [Flavobacteriales bacterium]